MKIREKTLLTQKMSNYEFSFSANKENCEENEGGGWVRETGVTLGGRVGGMS